MSKSKITRNIAPGPWRLCPQCGSPLKYILGRSKKLVCKQNCKDEK